MTLPKISIITPTYNAAQVIAACLESVAQQAYPHLEHWIIDGLSQDNTLSIVQEYAQRHPHIKYISEKDQGIYDAMNKGIDLATGEFLLFLGADDAMEKDVLRFIFSDISNQAYDLVYGIEILGDRKLGRELKNLKDLIFDTYLPKIHYFFPHKSTFIKRELFLLHGNYDLDYSIAADMHFFIKVISSSKVKKKFINLVISQAGTSGLSSTTPDIKFEKDLPYLIKKHIGIDIDNKRYYRNFAKYYFEDIYKKNLLKGLKGIAGLILAQGDLRYYLGHSAYWLKRRFFDK